MQLITPTVTPGNDPAPSLSPAEIARYRRKLRAARGTWAVLRREGLPLPRALWCFGRYAASSLRRRAGGQP